jgi:arginine deiminase
VLWHRQPWVSRAQQEHDCLAQLLRDHGVRVLYLTELLQDTMEYQRARDEAIAGVLADPALGDDLAARLRGYLAGLDPEALALVLVAGLTAAEFPAGRGLVFGLLGDGDFVIDPLPDLVFTRDASVWLGDRALVAGPAGPARRREPALHRVIYSHHPLFAGNSALPAGTAAGVSGGDLLQLAPGVIAAGIGTWTSPAGVERLATGLFEVGLARTVLAVPTARAGAAGWLDTLCTVVGGGTLLMHPGLAYTLSAHVITPGAEGLRVSRPRPFLDAAAEATGTEAIRLISTGADPFTTSRRPWDEGGNLLAIAPGLVVSHERNTDVNARLAAAGVEVIEVPGNELGSVRGGPRCLACAVSREPAGRTVPAPAAAGPEARLAGAARPQPARASGPPSPAGPRGQDAVPAPVPAGAGAASGAGRAGREDHLAPARLAGAPRPAPALPAAPPLAARAGHPVRCGSWNYECRAGPRATMPSCPWPVRSTSTRCRGCRQNWPRHWLPLTRRGSWWTCPGWSSVIPPA